jgi:hypothetical protein
VWGVQGLGLRCEITVGREWLGAQDVLEENIYFMF